MREGEKVFEPDKHRETAPKSQKEKYKYAEMITAYKPCTNEKFCDYVRMHDDEVLDRFLTAGKFLNYANFFILFLFFCGYFPPKSLQ